MISAQFALKMYRNKMCPKLEKNKIFILAFKVIQCHCFWCQLKTRVQLLISGLISHRFQDTATYWLKITNFPYLYSFQQWHKRFSRA